MISKHITGIICTLFIGAALTSQAQQAKQSERDSTKQWEIGLDLLWLIDKNQVPATSLFARYNFVNKNNKKQALRFRLGIDNSTYDSAQIDDYNNEADIYSIYGRIGYEWQKEVGEKALFFYGLDVSFLYAQFNSKIVLYPGPNLLQVTDKTWETGLSPFVGFKYRPEPWFAISIESSLALTYRIRREKDKVTDINYPDSSGLQGTIDVNDFSILFLPITVVNLSFYLVRK